MIIDEKVRWMAKYPFDSESRDFLKNIALSLDEFLHGDYRDVLEYAYKRALDGIKGNIRKDWSNDYVESVSYYLATLIVAATKNSYIYRRFAEAEAKRAYLLLQDEKISNILRIGKNVGLEMNYNDDKFEIFFVDFIKAARNLSSIHWRLYNFKLQNGYVLLDKRRTARLLTQLIKERIFEMIVNVKVVPQEIVEISKNILDNLPEKMKASIKEIFEIENISEDEYPPCIKLLIEEIGKGLSHPGRFTLVTFLSSVGLSTDEIIKLFRVTPDFNEKMTRYQVEHILGMRGSRIKYSVPSCKKIRSYGYCIPDEICRRYNIKHPLNYIKLKRRRSKDRQ